MTKLIKTCFCSGILLMLFLSGCDHFLDEAAKDPNTVTSVPIKQQVSPLIADFAYTMNGGFPARISANWTQQISYNGDTYYYQLDIYQLGEPWTPFNGVWTSAYSTLAKNAKVAYENAQKKGYPNYEGIAKIIFAWTMADMTNDFGAIPYSGAFDATKNFPKFDPQSEIYPKLLKLLDSAITNLKKDAKQPFGTDDLLYQGDISKWIRLAYTLKARFLMQLTEAPDHKTQQRATQALTALSHGFQSNDDNATFSYTGDSQERNPWYPIVNNPAVNYIQMSAYYINLLRSLGDPRLPIQAQVAEKHLPGKKYRGHKNGAPGIPLDSVSNIGLVFVGPSAPGRLLDYAEAKFLEAQAKLITQGAAAADQPYREAIRADMKELGVSNSDIVAYLNNRENLAVSSNPLRDIMVQKYIANFLNPQAWNDWRKTGYPELQVSLNPNQEKPNFNAIPRRYAWPNTIINNNLDNLKKLGLPLDYHVMQKTVWWDTRGSSPATIK